MPFGASVAMSPTIARLYARTLLRALAGTYEKSREAPVIYGYAMPLPLRHHETAAAAAAFTKTRINGMQERPVKVRGNDGGDGMQEGEEK